MLFAIMGCQDLPWMKVPLGLSVLPESLNGVHSTRNQGIFDTDQSAAEYGFHKSTPGGSPSPNKLGKKKARESLGNFIDNEDGKGARLHLTEEEIKWVHKHFFLL